MNLKSIELNNFRLFYGNQILNFNDDLNVIVGKNGTGKSSIIAAINWCLYGIGNTSILNFKAAEENDEKIVSVKCIFEDKNNLININRLVFFNENNDIVSRELNVVVNDSIVENPNYFIENEFPKNLYDLNEFSLNQDIYSLKGIFEKEFGVSDLYKVIDHLTSLQKSYYISLSKINPQMDNDIEMLEARLNKVSEHIHMTDIEIKSIEKKIREYQMVFEGNFDFKSLLMKRDELSREIKMLSMDIKKRENKFNSLLIKKVPLSIVYSKYISSANPLELNQFEELLYENISNSDMIGGFYMLKREVETLADFDEIEVLLHQIKELREEYNKKILLIEDINSELNLYPNINIDSIMKLENVLDDLRVRKDKLSAEKRFLMSNLKKLSKNIVEEEELIDIEIKIDFISKVIKSINELIHEINEATHKGLVNSVNNYFLENSFLDYDEVIIDDDYNISLLKSGFKINYKDLSSAERELLRLSLILSISDVVNNKFPLIMDTPFGALDTSSRESIVNMLGNIKIQKLLLLNESEAINLPIDYELQFKNGNGVIVYGE